MKRLVFAVAAFLIISSCGDKSVPVPPGAKSTTDGVRWVRVTNGAGRLGAESIWWSVDWKEVPCQDCDEHVYNGRSDNSIYDQFRSNLVEMREGEMRRIWVPTSRGRYAAYDLRLDQVFETGKDGQPIVVNQ